MQSNPTATALRPAARILRWPAVLSLILAVALMVSSLHHLSCIDDDGAGGSVAAVSIGMDKSAPPSGTDQCLPGHCHCVCHGSAQTSARLISTLALLVGDRIGMREDRLPPADMGSPPFKP